MFELVFERAVQETSQKHPQEHADHMVSLILWATDLRGTEPEIDEEHISLQFSSFSS